MKTIVFHSHKGGAGRTLAVANCGVALGRAGHKVLLIDLNFGSPGLEFKFGLEGKCDRGYVDYLSTFSAPGRLLKDNRKERLMFLKQLSLPASKNLTLLAPGRRATDHHRTQRKGRSGRSISSDVSYQELAPHRQDLLDIRDAFNQPDFCIVDCGRSLEQMQIPLFAWADHIVEVFPCSKEGVYGASLMEKMLSKSASAGRLPGITYVVSRVPSDATDEAIRGELTLIAEKHVTARGNHVKLRWNDVAILHELRILEIKERILLLTADGTPLQLRNDYFRLLNSVVRHARFKTKDFPVSDPHEHYRADLERGEEIVERVFQFFKKAGELRNVDNKRNVAFRDVTIVNMVDSIGLGLEAILGRQQLKGAARRQLVGGVFNNAGLQAGRSFGQSAMTPGTMFARIPEGIQERLDAWCKFDANAGFGSWQAKYSNKNGRGQVRLDNHFLKRSRRYGIFFVSGYVNGVLQYLLSEGKSGGAVAIDVKVQKEDDLILFQRADKQVK